jgi:hypothetical protein
MLLLFGMFIRLFLNKPKSHRAQNKAKNQSVEKTPHNFPFLFLIVVVKNNFLLPAERAFNQPCPDLSYQINLSKPDAARAAGEFHISKLEIRANRTV